MYDEIKHEQNKWKVILKRILCVILFIAERGLPLRGDTDKLGDPCNGNFLGIIELLAKFDPVLSDHVNQVKVSQQSGKRLQVHYLSKDIQNELIEMAGNLVKENIIDDIRKAKYFAIAVDGTPDASHQEQLSFIIRYLAHKASTISIEERFLSFENFSKKTGREIAEKILQFLKEIGLNFNDCMGQAYDNGSNMAGKYIGVQALLTEENEECIFCSCANHTLNLVGVDCAKSCTEAVTFLE